MGISRPAMAMVLGAAFATAGSGGVAGAAISLDATGVTLLGPAPASAAPGQLVDLSAVSAWDEQQRIALPADLAVDITTTGVYDEATDLTPGTIPAGTVVSSHFLHADTGSAPTSPRVAFAGTVTFDRDILGIIVTSENLDASDPLVGSPGTAYATGVGQRRLGLVPGDPNADILVHPDGRTVSFSIATKTSLDELRVVTSGNTVPDCTGVAAQSVVWPPNHKLKRMPLSGATDPDGDPVTITATGVTQDEPVNGLADGNTAFDAKLLNGVASVRAERSGLGDGRVYRISYTATDALGGSCSGVATVGVPHSRSGAPIVDSGDVFPSY